MQQYDIIKYSIRNLIKISLLNQHLYKIIMVYTLFATHNKELFNKNFIKLENLECSKNISSINHLINLKNLDDGVSPLLQKNIIKLNKLKMLSCYNNKIFSVNHLKKLKNLNCSDLSEINQEGISKISSITKIICSDNTKIISVNHFRNLRYIRSCGACGLMEDGISKLSKLNKFICDDNKKITNINCLNNLKKLSCYNNSGLDQNGISNLTNLVHLDCALNNKIYDVNHCTKLKVLYCWVKIVEST